MFVNYLKKCPKRTCHLTVTYKAVPGLTNIKIISSMHIELIQTVSENK